MDDFKLINDKCGHVEGDNILRCTAASLSRYISDLKGVHAGRWGGEEFMIYVQDRTLSEVEEIAQTIASMVKKGGIEPLALAVFGALLGFLMFNVYPAKVIMGDTGSLALGGFVAASAYVLKMPLFIVLVGFIYLLEVISVMLQVTYFKKTGGKRIFRMAPIHHHFELGGWSETRVVAIFTIVTTLLCVLGYIGL